MGSRTARNGAPLRKRFIVSNTRKTDRVDKPAVLPSNPDVRHITASRTALAGAMGRAQKILRTYAADGGVRGYLETAGFNATIYEEGWRLLRRAYGERELTPQPPPPTSGVLVVVERLETETSSIFGRVRAVLRRFYPAQESFVFTGLSAASGFESVVALQTLLDRVDALEKGTSKETQKQDHAAVLALEARGVGQELRGELRKLCAMVESAPTSVRPRPAPAAEPEENEREARLLELYAWVQDWSETARCVIPDKRLLRRMGIGKRKARATKEPPVIVPPAPAAGAPSGG
jgi:hypothetical protein